MSNKTEYGFDERNFIEQDDKLHEITVEITLNEYRELIESRCFIARDNEKLREANENLIKQKEILNKIIYEKIPALKNILNQLFKEYGEDVLTALKINC